MGRSIELLSVISHFLIRTHVFEGRQIFCQKAFAREQRVDTLTDGSILVGTVLAMNRPVNSESKADVAPLSS